MTTAPITMTLERARAAWIQAQGLDGSAGTALRPVLERTGFVRTLGGVDVYLALKARLPGLRRADLDAAVMNSEAQVIPAVRGCIYLVGRRDVPVALRLADSLARARGEKEQAKAGIKKGEIDKVAKAVLALLEQRGALTTDAIRKGLGDKVVRSLGEAGKKVGMSSPLPSALRVLEFDGKVERTLDGGRLDSERYLWRAVKQQKQAAGAARLPADRAGLLAIVGELFVRASGPAHMKEFSCWSGVGQREAKAAFDSLALIPIVVDGLTEPRWAFPDQVAAWKDQDAARQAVAFLPFEDNLIALQGGAAALIDQAHHGITVPSWGMARASTIGQAKHMSARCVVGDGKVVGLWDFDPDAGEVVYRCFAPVAAATRARLDRAAGETSKFLADDLGHGRSFSLDTDDELRKRSAWVRGMGAKPTARRSAR